MSVNKSLIELNLEDDFMFSKVMSDMSIAKPVLEKVLGKPIGRISVIEPEHVIEIDSQKRGIRLDVYLADENQNHYNIEMQTSNKYDIGRRSRYHHSLMDLDLIKKGQKFKDIKDGVVIFFCTYDPFKRSLCQYTFENRCLELPDVSLDDGITTIVINTKGTQGRIDDDIRALLPYFENSTDDVAEASENGLVRMIHEKVKTLKDDITVREDYVKLRELMMEQYEAGHEFGYELGKTGLRITMIRNMLNENLDQNLIRKLIGRDDDFVDRVLDLIKADPEISDQEILAACSGSKKED